ncbi:hypothetical protein QYE76_024939 [Lolium multiflorum]|uniref:Cathepsin propeptide inhibitor domain-containing protein n=1 Tax=Lolium multiflorum TaxID=4521 RepID=A0AAD8RFY2_LOLMU|nr:hypothetical protein QYE76_024939 [Lolium multiflorum]
MFRRAAGSLVARWFSPRAAPRTAPPARSLQPSSDRHHRIGEALLDAYICAAAASAGAVMMVVARNFMEGTGFGQSAAGKVTGSRNRKEVTVKYKKPDMEERFERWIYKNNKTYRDEKEKAMRFQRFKATVEWIESQPLDVQERYFPEITYFADFTEEERDCMLAYPHRLDRTECYETVNAVLAKQEKVEPDNRQATQVSA